ncbi:hypothetical protein QL993_25965 [Bacillus wiedmannii]|uniref:hypothetical protein n=1 Tax=Bacillus TaxID=1386 RepID=UPI000BF875DE|nr:hypothetical protein [Bacillus wiedmannii]MDI6508172.1 hypothetical protein [Bacillus wiedmannii]MDI6513945.1 hypothetical protein [Bacillus wiedmannii]PGC10524.1 hypothetical protein COM08_30440 [Bacillus wiedmannii]HDR7963246.1 hypothetical protein [Bacillus wiedmannii]
MNRKIKHIGSYPSDSEHESGFTELNEQQNLLLTQISLILENTNDGYDSFPRLYAPKGLIAVLQDQVHAKLSYESISKQNAIKSLELINELKISLHL